MPIKSVFNSTIRTDSFHHAVGLFDGESFRMWNGGGVNVLYAEGLSAGCAGKMDMRGMCASAFASAVYLRSAAVIDFVQEFVVQKQRECSVGFTSASVSILSISCIVCKFSGF